MRPKKVVLILGGDEQRISECRSLLSVHGFRRVGACELGDYIPDAVIGFWPCGEEVIAASRLFSVQSLVIAPPDCKEALDMGAHSVIRNDTQPWEIIERVLIMTARKRGPRKKPASFVPEEIGAGRKAG